MTLVKTNYRPGQRTLSTLFDELFNEFPAAMGNYVANGNVAVNIAETNDAYHLELNAPGRAKEDFKIGVEDGMLTIGFEKKEEIKREDVKTIRREFSFQSFKRSFNLDDKIDAAGIQAKYENGLLKIFLPKKAEVKEAAKQITIQ